MKFALSVLFALLFFAGCGDELPTEPLGAYFTVDVEGERFKMFVTETETLRLARENLQGKNQHFPIGTIQFGHAGYNQPWSWSLVPATIRMTEAAIEVCDGLPSYVNEHVGEYVRVGYCPWGAKIVAEGR